jgi:hypothetical protein
MGVVRDAVPGIFATTDQENSIMYVIEMTFSCISDNCLSAV